MGCNTLEEFDQMVTETATGEALEDWEKVKNQYDTADSIEASIWATCGIIAIGGFVISATMGLFSFGIGFVGGLAVVGTIIGVLGAVGLLFDAIVGAIERAQLREAIKNLCTARLKIKQLVNQSHAIEQSLPAINNLWDSIIKSAGNVDKEMINKMIADDKEGLLGKPWTYERTASTLKDMDKSRSSWTDEDPNFMGLAKSLDKENARKQAPVSRATRSLLSTPKTVTMGSPLRTAPLTISLSEEDVGTGEDTDVGHEAGGEEWEYYEDDPDLIEAIMTTSTISDDSLDVYIAPVVGAGSARIFGQNVKLAMENILSEERGRITITTNDGQSDEYIAEVLELNSTDDNETTTAKLLLFSPDMPTECLQPDGSFSTDTDQAAVLVNFV